MKLFLLMVMLMVAFLSCNNDGNNIEHSNHDTASDNTKATADADDNRDVVVPVFTSLDKDVSAHISEIFDHYIHIKTALVNSNADEAKQGAKALLNALKNFDRSLLPVDQKQAYDKSKPGLTSAATGINSSDDIKQQREHFESLSIAAYDLAKSFGAGKPVYHQHCPMAFNNKGAMWLSESDEVKNPFYGDEMLECGTVEEVIKK